MEVSAQHSPSGDNKESLALECVELLGRLAALYDERRKQLSEDAGLTLGQWQVLEEIQREHFMPSLFAQGRASSAAAVSKVLRQLTDKGLITAHVSEKDARQRDYVVTASGKKLLMHVHKQRRLAIEKVWLNLSHDELAHFRTVGSSLAQQLQDFAASSRQAKE